MKNLIYYSIPQQDRERQGQQTTENITHRTQSEEACDVLLLTIGTRHIVAKDHKPLEKMHMRT